jgi:hypothetical protein
MPLKYWIGLWIAAALSLGLISPAGMAVWIYTPRKGLESALEREALSVIRLPNEADLDQEGELECLRLEDGRAAIYAGVCEGDQSREPLWQSSADWDVRQAQLSDLDGDGWMEVTLLVWRDFTPWPIDTYLGHPGYIESFQDNNGRSCHLILIGSRYCEGYCELWAGSALADPLQSFTAADLDGDGLEEIAALEGAYDDPPGSASHALTIWAWNGFGFNLQSRVDGEFKDLLVLETPNNQARIITGVR